jgi:pyruvate/2-oxoglutarate dehydrogenase complex dihydrolipoamide dehydrogenase (E3) component
LLRVETGTRRRVIYEVNGEERFVEAEQILAALGRSPATEHLGLEAAGVTRRGRTVVTGLNQETSARGIFAAGDVCGPLEVVHLAIEQGELAAWNAARFVGKVTAPERVMDYRLKLFGVFCEPQVAVAGLSEREMAQSGRRIGSADYPFNDHGKSMVQGETEGFVKLWADLDTGELLAGLVVGPEAVELIHEVVIALRFRCTVGEFAKIPHYHPSLSEIWTYPAEELSERVGKE